MTFRTKGVATVLVLLVGIVVGILLLLGFDATMKATSTEQFCISCHEMQAFPYQESLDKPHASNHAGVGVTCGDCHIPKAFVPKMKRKIIAAREVWHHMLGTLDTPEKYEARREQMAKTVWQGMEEDDSASCRNCHTPSRMSDDSMRLMHESALSAGSTCIDCHKGIAHTLPGVKN